MMVYGAILTPHPLDFSCGTGKWSKGLARALGVNCAGLDYDGWGHVLVSARMSELPLTVRPPRSFDLLVHDWTTWDDFTWPSHWDPWLTQAKRIFAASPTLCEQIRSYRADVTVVPIPSALTGKADRAGYRVLTFGMAHKRLLPHFQALKVQLEREHPKYTISLSTAIHEGAAWEPSLRHADNSLREVFGERFRFLGFLADDALAAELQACDAVALFYTPALRANNTSYWAAVEAGKTIYTNRDAQSPRSDEPAPTWAKVKVALGA